MSQGGMPSAKIDMETICIHMTRISCGLMINKHKGGRCEACYHTQLNIVQDPF